MLKLDSISYAYPGGRLALDGFTARLPVGLTLLAGPNAGGKTTLMRLLAGLASPAAGGIVRAASGEALAAATLRDASRMVMQDAEPQILGSLVGEDVMLGQASSSLGGRFAEEAAKAAARFGLAAHWHAPVEALSHGQKRKLCLMHALLAGPDLLLLDEPFSGLDYPSARELRDCIADNKRRGLPQVVSVHDLEPLFSLADWLIVVDGGKVAAEGRPEALRPNLASWSVRPPRGGWD